MPKPVSHTWPVAAFTRALAGLMSLWMRPCCVPGRARPTVQWRDEGIVPTPSEFPPGGPADRLRGPRARARGGPGALRARQAELPAQVQFGSQRIFVLHAAKTPWSGVFPERCNHKRRLQDLVARAPGPDSVKPNSHPRGALGACRPRAPARQPATSNPCDLSQHERHDDEATRYGSNSVGEDFGRATRQLSVVASTTA